jgi:hypothetical protein
LIIKTIRYIEKEAKVFNHDDLETLKEKLDDISWYVRDLEYELEELRRAIEGVREWGQRWKNLAKEFIEKGYVNLEDYGLLIKKDECYVKT